MGTPSQPLMQALTGAGLLLLPSTNPVFFLEHSICFGFGVVLGQGERRGREVPRSPRMASVGTTVGRMVRGTKAGQLGTADSGPRTPPSPAPGGQGWHRAGPGCRPAPAGPTAQAEQEQRRRGLRAELWPQEGLTHGPRPTSLGRHLGAGEDDGFLQVFQHKGKHGGGESHGVGAVEDDEAVVLLVVCLQGGGAASGRPALAIAGLPGPGARWPLPRKQRGPRSRRGRGQGAVGPRSREALSGNELLPGAPAPMLPPCQGGLLPTLPHDAP